MPQYSTIKVFKKQEICITLQNSGNLVKAFNEERQNVSGNYGRGCTYVREEKVCALILLLQKTRVVNCITMSFS